MFKIEWINHAGFILNDTNNISLACDPWVKGNVFNKGWDLLANSKHKVEDLEKVNFIWASHNQVINLINKNLLSIEARNLFASFNIDKVK